jgi:hypothetical protein
MADTSRTGSRITEHGRREGGRGAMTEEPQGFASAVAEKAGDAWEGATEGVRHAASTVSEYACDAWDDAVGFMRRYPGATLCAGLGVGFLLGCVLRNSLPGLSDGGRMTTRMSYASQGRGGPEYGPPTGSY